MNYDIPDTCVGNDSSWEFDTDMVDKNNIISRSKLLTTKIQSFYCHFNKKYCQNHYFQNNNFEKLPIN